MSKGDILIVDDNPHNLTLLAGILREAGYRVRAAKSGQLALDQAGFARPDLIMLDIMMPEMDGYETCRRLKATEHGPLIPVIFISALNDVLDKVRGFEVGGVDFVTKPFQAEEVLARVDCQLKIFRLQRELAALNAILEEKNRELERANAELTRHATTDVLTGLFNRRKFIEAAEEEIKFSQRHGTPFALVMLDVDHFKKVNDTHGHDQGDEVLRHVAKLLRSRVRTTDITARWGGEEFMVLLRHTDLKAGEKMAEKMRESLALTPAGSVGAVTASFGVTAFEPTDTLTSLSSRVDALLYEAKAAGRNRVHAGGIS
ncbi:diguanylate cyclase [Deinococcus roseus]|uniref:Diguanylate cyclase response regulator n=1 Tax=Deinococcus roseus TaxID=392414 RepID=A0ABQ2DC39_9DEIO|nr:diguanylate cyclase [Deinococcus roseus]GGJ51983.1 diguanylate cyclase response regulator [Deinococcus roseus]